MCVQICVHMYMRVCANMRVCVYIYIYIYIYMYVCVHLYVRLHVYVGWLFRFYGISFFFIQIISFISNNSV